MARNGMDGTVIAHDVHHVQIVSWLPSPPSYEFSVTGFGIGGQLKHARALLVVLLALGCTPV